MSRSMQRLVNRACGALLLAAGTATAAHAATVTTIYSFTGGADGANPHTNLVASNDGGYFGTTTYGGMTGANDCDVTIGCGVVFKLMPPAIKGAAWTETVLYTFTGGTDGGNPTGLVLGTDHATLYGTTFDYSDTNGNGTIFSLTPPIGKLGPYTETILHYFAGGAPCNCDGKDPDYPLIIGPDGTLYGTTIAGGPSLAGCPGAEDGCGTVWKLSPPYAANNYSLVYAFQGGTDGSDDYGGVTLTKRGTLVGMNSGGGIGAGYLYEMLPPAPTAPPGTQWTEAVRYVFNPAISNLYGGGPSRPVVGPHGDFYDVVFQGGPGSLGTVLQIVPQHGSTWTVNLLSSFSGADGSEPQGTLFTRKGILYGTTPWGGVPGCSGQSCDGVLFQVAPPTSGATTWTKSTLHTFTDGPDGALPDISGSLIPGPKGSMLGVTATGGAFGFGTIFQVTP